MIPYKFALPIAGLTLAMALCAVAQQARANPSQQNSIVEAARKARERKDQKAAKVYTNEDLTQLKGDVSVVGQTPESQAPDKSSDKTAAGSKTQNSGEAAKDEAAWRKRFADARRTLADDSRELDILQREFNLKQQQFYSDPNVALREQNSRKDLDDTQAKIDAKKADVQKDGLVISDLQDALRKAGGDSGWATEPVNNNTSNPGSNSGSGPGTSSTTR